MLLSARGSSAPQQRRSLPAASAASRSAAPIEQQQRSLASAARAIFFFLRAVTYLGSWPLDPPCFFWTSSRVLLLGYTPGYGGREKGDMGSGAWVADASILKNVWIDIAYSAWQKASVKPAVAKMAVNVRSAD